MLRYKSTMKLSELQKYFSSDEKAIPYRICHLMINLTVVIFLK